uniref:Uncharacterized protein n=1 Tax=Vibrio tasmaniensis TaxID=212663 RepID=A0A0H3ZSA6_9VIBR|nr:hypothetical protein [Vibrio tasmaniensis]
MIIADSSIDSIGKDILGELRKLSDKGVLLSVPTIQALEGSFLYDR